MARIYSVTHGRSERFFPSRTKAITEAQDLGSSKVWCYEPLTLAAGELQTLMLNGQRWWFSRKQIHKTGTIAPEPPMVQAEAQGQGSGAGHG
jgi:hypothetical protein